MTEQIGITYDFTRCFEWQYVISGANGNTGSIIANSLLSKDEKVRVMGRDAGRLQRFVGKDAEAFTADLSDAAALFREHI